jgi:hypothetical protein
MGRDGSALLGGLERDPTRADEPAVDEVRRHSIVSEGDGIEKRPRPRAITSRDAPRAEYEVRRRRGPAAGTQASARGCRASSENRPGLGPQTDYQRRSSACRSREPATSRYCRRGISALLWDSSTSCGRAQCGPARPTKRSWRVRRCGNSASFRSGNDLVERTTRRWCRLMSPSNPFLSQRACAGVVPAGWYLAPVSGPVRSHSPRRSGRRRTALTPPRVSPRGNRGRSRDAQ